LAAGRGRFRHNKAKQTTGKCPSLDVRRLQRNGLLRPAYAFPYHWRRNEQRAASVDVRVEADYVALSYCYRTCDGESKSAFQSILIERAPCYYGRQRVWFRCPQDGCGRGAAILYGNVQLCMPPLPPLAYPSQRKPAYLRALGKAQAIRRWLGGTANMSDLYPEKPKGMHRQTYERLRRQHDIADANSWPSWLRRRIKPA
jgi:hypothetical protein